jgi:hypothetical protein
MTRTTSPCRLAVALPLLLSAASFAAPVAAAETPSPAHCTTEGMNWSADPVFHAALHPSQRERTFRSIACQVETVRELEADGIRLRLTLGKLFHDRIDGPAVNVKLVDVAQVESGVARSIARVFLGPDPLDASLVFAPQVRSADGDLYLRLSPRHSYLFRLRDGALSALHAFGWRAALDGAFPQDGKSGQALSVDLERMEGRIAIRSIARDPGQASASAYAGNRILVAKLAFRDGGLVAESTDVTRREAGEEPFLDLVNEMDETVRTGLKGLPDGTEPCSLGAWSNDRDPAGLNVRAAPNAQAKVLGIVPPPRKLPREHEFTNEPVKSEFRVVGHRDGWFLIEDIQPPGVAYEAPYPRHLPQPFKGRGWVSGRMIGGALANGGLPQGRLYVSPHADAASIEVIDSHGNPIGPDTPIRRIHACSGWWALIETNEGHRGWWRSMCSDQATNCS